MQHLKTALAVAVAGFSLSLAGAANAAMPETGMSVAADHVTVVDQVDFLFGGHRHCWYADGWNGPGRYWCGYRQRHGMGFGGGEGFRGWRHR